MDLNLFSKHDIFPIEITQGIHWGKWIIYLPLVGYHEIVSKELIDQLYQSLINSSPINMVSRSILSHLNDPPRKIYKTSDSIDGLLNLMILPNNKCNFHCSYCYSAHGRSNIEIAPKKLEAGLAYFFNRSRAKGERLTISVLGGGEPLLSWEILKPALEYALSLNKDNDQNLPISLVTNGSVVNEEIIAFCKKHAVSISVSFDLLEDVQRKQRGHYERVAYNINKLTESGLDVALNTVITHENINRMEEMIDTMSQTLVGVNKVAFKPLISSDYFTTIDARALYYQNFVDNFFSAWQIAKQKGIYLTCAYLNAVRCLADRYCPGKFVITAEGSLSICHCVSSSQDTLYDKFIFGGIDRDGTVSFNQDKFNEIISYNMHKHKRCEHCAAKWHCAGGCYADGQAMNEEQHEAYCKSMRYFLEKYLLNISEGGIV